ncbi:MAG TPA: hypothetical protein ENF17_08025 [Candidatus Aminicenantes bacterium]|nr:hypothetical protein [Candidatus Aminicenantes bacterium]
MRNWFVINTKPKKEFQVEKILQEANFVVYNPKYSQEGLIKPFFPGYQFVCFDFPAQYRLIRYTRGVKKVVGNSDGPIAIAEEVIHEIKAREIDGLIELNKYGEEPGVEDEIEVMEGPFKGLRGIFRKELTDNERVIILLNYISYQGKLIIEKKKLKKVIR